MSLEGSQHQEKMMQKMFRGTGVWRQMNTGFIDEHVKVVREYAANIFFYTKNGKTLMIDAGYNYPRLKEKMGWLDIDPKSVTDILITHIDTDHTGALEKDSEGLFRNAKIYLGEIENEYLTGERRRKVFFGLYALPEVVIPNEKVLLRDGQVFTIDGIKIECILMPGHTIGHMAYLIDDEYLFTGDTIWFGIDGGYSFLSTLAWSNKEAKKSLARLETLLRERKLHPVIITGHTGWTDNLDFAFAQKDRICGIFTKRLPDPQAPYDGYDESDDTEENTRREVPIPRKVTLEDGCPDYKNWMPQGMIFGFTAVTVVCAVLCGLVWGLMKESSLKTVLILLADAGIILGACVTIWALSLYKAFDYFGKRKMSKQIIDGVSDHIRLPEGGVGLDVGCGSGALIIACAKKNPRARMVGIDRWGKEYASFSNELCESNARAEGVRNAEFRKGDANKLDFADETFDAVTSNYVYHNIPVRDRQVLLRETLRCLKKGGTFAIHDIFSKAKYGDMQKFLQELRDNGYEDVRLIDTTDGLFMSRREAMLMGLSGSAILCGKK